MIYHRYVRMYLDVTRHLKKSGDDVTNNGNSWVNLYFPIKQWEKLCRKFGRTGWKLVYEGPGVTFDKSQGLVSASTAYYDDTNPPVVKHIQPLLNQILAAFTAFKFVQPCR